MLFRSNESHLQVFHSGTKTLADGAVLTSGGRVLSIVGQEEDFNKTFKLIYQSIQGINFKGMHYRRDIGYQVRNNLDTL